MIHWFAALFLPLWGVNPPISHQNDMGHYHHEEAELHHTSEWSKLATGNIEDSTWVRGEHPWPVDLLSIGHSIASYQHYIGEPYFHHGIDIRAEAGSSVIASAAGKVVNIENYIKGNPAYWEVAILDDQGFLWQYHHVNRESIPKEIFAALKSGSRIPSGTKIGEVYRWPVFSFGERFNHIHLNVLGAKETYVNPFLFLRPLNDRQKPEILKVGLVDKKGFVDGQRVSGAYTLYAMVQDLVLHEKYQLPPHRIWLSIDGGVRRDVWVFNSLPGGRSKTDYVHQFYIPKMTCGNYTCRRFAINLGFSVNGQLRFPGKGKHTAIVGASDFAGNITQYRFDWLVEN